MEHLLRCIQEADVDLLELQQWLDTEDEQNQQGLPKEQVRQAGQRLSRAYPSGPWLERWLRGVRRSTDWCEPFLEARACRRLDPVDQGSLA